MPFWPRDVRGRLRGECSGLSPQEKKVLRLEFLSVDRAG